MAGATAIVASASNAPTHDATLSNAATPAAALGSNWYGAAPYVMPLDNNPPDLSQVMAATGQKSFMLAFILAPNGGGCSPTWGGNSAVSSDTAVAGVVNAVRGNGG